LLQLAGISALGWLVAFKGAEVPEPEADAYIRREYRQGWTL